MLTGVLKELGIDGDTSSKIRNIHFEYRTKKIAAAQSLAQAPRQLFELKKNATEEELKQKRKELFEKYDADTKKNNEEINEKIVPQLKAALTAEQLERLQQIAWQAFGI